MLAVNGCKASLFMPGLVESFSAHWETHPRPTQSGSKMDFLSYIQLYFIVKKSFKEIPKKNTRPNGFHQVRWEDSYHNHMEIENCAICKASVKPCKKKNIQHTLTSTFQWVPIWPYGMLNWHPFWNHLACVERSAWQEKSRSAKQQAK